MQEWAQHRASRACWVRLLHARYVQAVENSSAELHTCKLTLCRCILRSLFKAIVHLGYSRCKWIGLAHHAVHTTHSPHMQCNSSFRCSAGAGGAPAVASCKCSDTCMLESRHVVGCGHDHARLTALLQQVHSLLPETYAEHAVQQKTCTCMHTSSSYGIHSMYVDIRLASSSKCS